MLQGQPCGVSVIATPELGCSRFPLSSAARLMIVVDPLVAAVQAKVQLSRPVAGFQVIPPSTETSTAATRPPPVSAAVPVTVIDVPTGKLWPLTGNVTVEVGGARSVEGLAGNKPDCGVAGSAPMSANKLTVACFISGLALGPAVSCVASSPHPHRI